jgi:hypothetical protein
MPKYLIEREIPGVGSVTREQMREDARRSIEIAAAMGPEIHWLHSYVSGDKVYCVYYAANEELIREHSRRAGAPITAISEISSIVDASYID